MEVGERLEGRGGGDEGVGEVALSASVAASAAAMSAAREGDCGCIGDDAAGEEVEGEDAGAGEVALGMGIVDASTLKRVAVEKRRRCRTVRGLGGPRGRRNGRIGWGKAIQNNREVREGFQESISAALDRSPGWC